MKTFRYVFYGIINVQLSGHLHVGGEDDAMFSMVTDGEGEYILPAGTIAGVIRKGVSAADPALTGIFGDRDHESAVWFYDAPLSDVSVEKRSGTGIDSSTGTAVSSSLHTMYFIGDGAKACIRIQGFADTEQEKEAVFAAYKTAVNGIGTGVITFGAKRSSGAGTFQVLDAEYTVLDLGKEEDLDRYLEGVDACFEKCTENYKPELDFIPGGTMFELEAMIPSGILVGSGEDSEIADKVNISRIKEGEEIAFIPGTSIKGFLRDHSRRAVKALGLDKGILTDLYGEEEKEAVKTAGRVKTEDCDVLSPRRIIYNRIQIDRWLGGTIKSKKMDAEVIGTNTEPVRIRVWIQNSQDSRAEKTGKALIFLAMRDLGTGLASLGSGESIGWGRLKGQKLSINGQPCLFEENPDLGHGTIVCGEQEEEVKEWLKALEEK